MKRWMSLLLLCIWLPACAGLAEPAYEKYRYYFFNTFDTVVTLTAYAKDQAEFDAYAALVESEMTRYHRVFDLYHAYDGVYNLNYLNANAGKEPARAEPELIDLLQLIKAWRAEYGTALDPAMGGVLGLWHDAREDGTVLPDQILLEQAAQHMDYDQVIIDPNALTVFYADPVILLDLGAVAKGYAAQLVAQTLAEQGLDSFLLNAGGNVVCGAPPKDGRDSWTIAIEDLDGVSTREKIYVSGLSVVTSGDYQRYYVLGGKRYHHLIDPTTLYPAEYVRAVTIVHPDSGLADFLSTTAFLLPYADSRRLIERIGGAEGMWTLPDGSVEMTDGFLALCKN